MIFKSSLLCACLSIVFSREYAFEVRIGPVPSKQIIDMFREFLPSNPIIVEGGGHDGTDAIEWAQLLPNAQIFVFEPVLEFFDQALLKFSGHQDFNIKAYNFALSHCTGSAELFLSAHKENLNVITMSSSLLPPKEHCLYAPEIIFNNKISVKTTTLDDWGVENGVQKIDVLKLDIQGNELNVMMASPKLMSTVKVIVTEVEFVEAYGGQYLFEDVQNWLENLGFELVALFENHWFGDALFIRKE